MAAGVIQWYFPLSGQEMNRSGGAGAGSSGFGRRPVILPTDDNLDSSGGLKITVAKYLTPSGYDIARRGGLVPDLACGDHPRGPFGQPVTGRRTGLGWLRVGGAAGQNDDSAVDMQDAAVMDACIQLAMQQISNQSTRTVSD